MCIHNVAGPFQLQWCSLRVSRLRLTDRERQDALLIALAAAAWSRKPVMPLSAYPRPQLRRAQRLNLNGPWRFAFDNELRYTAPAEVERWPLTIEVPFAPEARRSGIGDTGFHRSCWYERDFEFRAAEADRKQP